MHVGFCKRCCPIAEKEVSAIGQHLFQRKEGRPGVVYQIPCRDCTGIYIGETGRAYKTRLAEHKKDLKPANLAKVDDNNFNKKTALVKHVIAKDHRVDWDHSKILTFEIDFTKR